MSDSIKIPFDSVPLNGGSSSGVATVDPPRPSFSRSTPDASVGLLPPTRKPVGVTLPQPMPPLPPAPTDAPAANPMASTPPPKAGSVRGFIWDLIRPTRTKWAILAGGVSLVAGAYGLNLVVPTPAAAPKKEQTETAKLDTPGPKVLPERQPGPSVGVERTDAGVRPVKHLEPAPLPEPSRPLPPVVRGATPDAAPVPTPTPIPVPPPIPTVPEPTPVVPIKIDSLPIPNFDDKKPAPGSLPPVTPPADDKTAKPDPPPLPPIQPYYGSTKPTTLPPVTDEKPIPLPTPTPPAGGKLPPVPAPTAPFNELPDPSKKVGTALPTVAEPGKLPAVDPGKLPTADPKLVPIPEVTPVDPRTVPLPAPSVPVRPAEGWTPGPLSAPGDLTGKPKDEKPVTLPPVSIDPKLPPVASLPDLKKPDPPQTFVEEKPSVTPVGGSVKEPTTPVSVSPPKKGFEVDVVRVRTNDTYASISEAFYQSKKYAAALRAFNGDVDIGRLQEVEVPPLHELQKQGGAKPRDAEPTGDGRTQPPVRGPVIEQDSSEPLDWGPQGKRRPVIEYNTMTTWKEGMTARDIARAVYEGDESQWPKLVGPRGAKLKADDPLPKGTEVTFPKEKTVWK